MGIDVPVGPVYKYHCCKDKVFGMGLFNCRIYDGGIKVGFSKNYESAGRWIRRAGGYKG